MYTGKIQNELQVILIGKWEKKKQFINHCYMDDWFDFYPNMDYALIRGDKIWHLKDKEHSIFDENSSIQETIKEADAFIYIDADPGLKDAFEKKRNKSKCFTIDYEPFKLDAFACLRKIEKLKQAEEIFQKSILLLGIHSKNNSDSLDSIFPIELFLVIAKLLYSVNYKNDSFKVEDTSYSDEVVSQILPHQP